LRNSQFFFLKVKAGALPLNYDGKKSFMYKGQIQRS